MWWKAVRFHYKLLKRKLLPKRLVCHAPHARSGCDGLEINCGAAAAWARAKGLVVGRRGEMAWGTSWKHPKKPFRQVINFKQTLF